MKEISSKDRFIELRAKGWTFDKIAKELQKSKQTLVNWSKDLQEEIANQKALELEVLFEKYYLTKEHKIKLFGETLQRLRTEIEKRDLSDIATDKLLDMIIKYAKHIEEAFSQPIFKDIYEIEEEKLEKELLKRLTIPKDSIPVLKVD